MEIYKAYKFRLYPTKEQREYFNRCIGCARFIYNWALEMKQEAYDKDGTSLSIMNDISPKIRFLKEEKPFLKEVDSRCLYGELNNLNTAYLKFFKEGHGFPKFKRKESFGSYNSHLKKNSIHPSEGYVKIPKCGKVKCVFHRNIDGIVKEEPYVTISRNTIGEFYISIQVFCDVLELPDVIADEQNTIGIDMGLKDLAILDDGTKFSKIDVDKKLEHRKKHLQRMLSKKVGFLKGQKKSNNFIKLKKKIAKLDANVARRREHYQFNVVSQIISKDCEYIGIEDLNVQGLSATGRSKKKLTLEEYAKLSQSDKKKYNRKKSKGFNKSVFNVGLSYFKTKLENKSRQSGKKVVKVGKFYASSQTCSNCGAKNKLVKNLKIREWVCPKCGTFHDRDINAAKNIRNEAIRIINEKCETTHKNLTRCNREVKSAENHRKEKTNMVGVNPRFVEPEIQVVKNGNTKNEEVVTTSSWLHYETKYNYNGGRQESYEQPPFDNVAVAHKGNKFIIENDDF